MSHQDPAPDGTGSPPRRRPTGAWAVIAVLLGLGILVPLLVPLYDSETPALFGFPFYYWFQFALVPVVSLFTFIAFRLSLKATAQDRPTFGLPSEPGEDR